MKEIGGYLELEWQKNKQLHPGAIALDCGRSCLSYLTEIRGIRRVLLPDFLCDSVGILYKSMGISVRSFEVNDFFLPHGETYVEEDEWMLLVDYYGSLTSESVDFWSALSNGRLIVDETQGYYRKAWKGVDTFWNCRKWFGVPDGALLMTRDGERLDREVFRAKSADWMRHVLGRAEGRAADFLADARNNERRLTGVPARLISTVSDALLSGIDHELVIKRRVENWHVIDAELASWNLLSTSEPEVPFMYPFLVADSTGMREELATKGIYIPTLWPNVVDDRSAGDVARCYANNILPLPLDQRYSAEDMQIMCRAVRETVQKGR